MPSLVVCGEFNSGEDGADKSDCVVLESSTSETEPLRFFFERENALLKELRNCNEWKKVKKVRKLCRATRRRQAREEMLQKFSQK